MRDWDTGDQQDGTDDVARRLREQRATATPLELDQMKTRAMARSRAPQAGPVRARLVVSLLSLSLLAAGTGGVLAAGKNSAKRANAAAAQYKSHGKTCDEQPDPAGCRERAAADNERKQQIFEDKQTRCDNKPTQTQRDNCSARLAAEKERKRQYCEDQSQQYQDPDLAYQQCLYHKGLTSTPPPGGGY